MDILAHPIINKKNVISNNFNQGILIVESSSAFVENNEIYHCQFIHGIDNILNCDTKKIMHIFLYIYFCTYIFVCQSDGASPTLSLGGQHLPELGTQG